MFKSNKGSAVLISIHYTEIQESNLLLINTIQTQISRMFDIGDIDRITLDFFRGSSKEGSRLCCLFLFHKLHKLSKLVLQGLNKTIAVYELQICRPIIYQCNFFTEGVSIFIDYFFIQ